jgi:hypothetical protein
MIIKITAENLFSGIIHLKIIRVIRVYVILYKRIQYTE